MKKYLVILGMALLASACMRGDYLNDPDIVGGRNSANNQEARKYMMYIADNLVTDVLDELELALSISGRGMATSAHFAIGGSFTGVGNVWEVKASDSQLCGMTLKCTAENTWTMEFEGEYVFGNEENRYSTRLSLKAERYVPEGSEASGWVVTLSGERKEGQYHCSFGTRNIGTALRYINTRGKGTEGWDQVFGDLYMTVFKADETVDVCCLSFKGAPSQASFLRGI